MPYYEDFEIGQRFVSPRRTITDGMATVLIDVGGFTADQFNDETLAKKTPLGWRAIPGRLIFALMGGLYERMMVSTTPSPGFLVGADKMVWKAPLRVGDTVHLECEIVEMRKTSNPKWGLVKDKQSLINQNGDLICAVEIIHLNEYRQKNDQ